MHKKICFSKPIGVITLITVITLISLLISSSLLKTKTSYESKAAPPKSPQKIYGGSKAEEGRWPFMVAILDKRRYQMCSGMLIAHQWILTAGHCVLGFKDRDIKIAIGSVDLTNKNILYLKIKKNGIYIHPKYIKYDYSIDAKYDLALLELNNTNKMPSNIFPIEINKTREFEQEGQQSLLLGWGRVEGYVKTPVLMQAVAPILARSRVLSWIREFNIDTYINEYNQSDLAVGFPRGGVGQCAGDSGGALLVYDGAKWLLKAVIRASEKIKDDKGETVCAPIHTPGISTNLSYQGVDSRGSVTHYYEWISSIIGQDTLNTTSYFSGAGLTNKETEEFDKKICDKTEWTRYSTSGYIIEDVPLICGKK